MKHKHHIIPRHMGGTDDPSNLVELTIDEHAAAHKKLWEEHGRLEDKLAWMGLAGMIDKEEIIRQQLSLASKKGNTGRKRPDLAEYNKGEGRKHSGGGWNKGMPRTEEEKALMSKNRKGKGGQKGKVISEEQKRKQSEAMKGRPAWNEGISRTEEEKNKISEGHKKLYENGHINHFKGKKHSPETRAKMKAYWAKRRAEKLQ